MKDIGLINGNQWHPFSYFGYKHSFFSIDADTVINTWMVLLVILILALTARIMLTRKSGIGRYLVISYVRNFIDLCNQSLGFFSFNHIAFIIALFTFIIVSNCIAIIPGIEEPTKELNTTLALGIIAFLYVQSYAIKEHSFFGYLKEYFVPFFVMFPLHVIGKLSSIVSISFRLFGNIFGGATIVHIYTSVLQTSWLVELFGLLSGLNLLIVAFFILFEGFLQAFVFTMLTITYLAIALTHDEDIGDMT